MAHDITIPPAALEAGARAIYLTFTEVNIGDGEDHWERLLPQYRAEYRAQARAAFLAMIEAWPKGGIHVPVGAGEPRKSFTLPALILPLTENPDAEA